MRLCLKVPPCKIALPWLFGNRGFLVQKKTNRPRSDSLNGMSCHRTELRQQTVHKTAGGNCKSCQDMFSGTSSIGCAWWACVCGFDHTAGCSVPAGFCTHVYTLPMCEEYRHYLKQLSVVGVMPSCHVDQSQKVLMCNCVSKLEHWPFHSPQGYADLPHLVCRI